jgi:uncharacterized protein involved in cysteine biosynthesis
MLNPILELVLIYICVLGCMFMLILLFSQGAGRFALPIAVSTCSGGLVYFCGLIIGQVTGLQAEMIWPSLLLAIVTVFGVFWTVLSGQEVWVDR